jgi:hypothetical protein
VWEFDEEDRDRTASLSQSLLKWQRSRISWRLTDLHAEIVMRDGRDVVERIPTGEEREQRVFVLTPWRRDTLAVPLSQLEVIYGDEESRQSVEDRRHWTARGYQL